MGAAGAADLEEAFAVALETLAPVLFSDLLDFVPSDGT